MRIFRGTLALRAMVLALAFSSAPAAEQNTNGVHNSWRMTG